MLSQKFIESVLQTRPVTPSIGHIQVNSLTEKNNPTGMPEKMFCLLPTYHQSDTVFPSIRLHLVFKHNIMCLNCCINPRNIVFCLFFFLFYATQQLDSTRLALSRKKRSVCYGKETGKLRSFWLHALKSSFGDNVLQSQKNQTSLEHLSLVRVKLPKHL